MSKSKIRSSGEDVEEALECEKQVEESTPELIEFSKPTNTDTKKEEK